MTVIVLYTDEAIRDKIAPAAMVTYNGLLNIVLTEEHIELQHCTGKIPIKLEDTSRIRVCRDDNKVFYIDYMPNAQGPVFTFGG